jgi:hypothetical protein
MRASGNELKDRRINDAYQRGLSEALATQPLSFEILMVIVLPATQGRYHQENDGRYKGHTGCPKRKREGLMG